MQRRRLTLLVKQTLMYVNVFMLIFIALRSQLLSVDFTTVCNRDGKYFSTEPSILGFLLKLKCIIVQ